ncbi:hypothetical protein JD844_005665 [Phrynosoma platyrhinos]|uniref:Uncharacterized protein n=1 Tax=Phrynosoma platyrhinos TaxID=52577 RepID=A0ABQ7TPF7_PHRPL|nr:hypothetical protein JD844_005665 [Phrynosoma platyrhinos]
MATKVQDQSLDTTCSDPVEERNPNSSIVAEHQDLDRDEQEAVGECSGAGTEHSEMPTQPPAQCSATSLQAKQEEEPKTETSLVPPPADVTAPVPVPPMGEGKGAKRMMEDDGDLFKEMPDVCQEARESGRGMLLPDLFGEVHQAHSSLNAGQAGGCAKVEQAIPCLSNVGSENQRKRKELASLKFMEQAGRTHYQPERIKSLVIYQAGEEPDGQQESETTANLG